MRFSDKARVIVHSDDDWAPSAFLHIERHHLEDKNEETLPQWAKENIRPISDPSSLSLSEKSVSFPQPDCILNCSVQSSEEGYLISTRSIVMDKKYKGNGSFDERVFHECFSLLKATRGDNSFLISFFFQVHKEEPSTDLLLFLFCDQYNPL